MGRRRKKHPLLENVEIIKIAAEGKAIGKVDDMVVFVPNAIPGDIVDIQVLRKRKSFMEGVITKYHTLSDLRVDAFCSHFGACGGCKWQMLPYEQQLEYKAQQVADNITRIGHVDIPEILPIVASERTTYYRNKLELSFSSKRFLTKDEIDTGAEFTDNSALGFHAPKIFDKIVQVDNCFLQDEPSNSIRNFVRTYTLENKLPYYNIKEKNGLMRTMIVRTSSTGEVMLIMTFFRNDEDVIEKLLTALKNEFPQITSLLYVINDKGNDTIFDLDVKTFSGTDCIYEEMEGLKFKISPKSFYQTNSAQAYELYKITREFANISESDVVYDLYTGTGTIANFVAKKAKKVIGIESVPDAIEDAKINSSYNNITNTDFFAGDMKDVLNTDFIAEHGAPDVIIADPPRAGMHNDVIETILKADPKRIVYVSCNPATQARDLQLLCPTYTVKAIQPVDMFPHTHHVENVVLLEK